MAAASGWSAARTGLLGDTGAADHAAQVDQMLGTHPLTAVYAGTQILTPNGSGGSPGSLNLGLNDWDQPFTMSGTAIGRVTIPVAVTGAGADLLVSLCADSGGSPGTVLNSVRIPAAWLSKLGTSSSLSTGAGPLATPPGSQILTGQSTAGTWTSPALGTLSTNNASSSAVSGNYMFFVGGLDITHTTPIASVYTIQWNGTALPQTVVPQPSLPAARVYSTAVITSDTIVVVAGKSTTAANFATDVWTASWNPNTGVIGAWSTQASYPIPLAYAVGAVSGETVYVTGGLDNSQAYNNVYYATVSNGQITSWKAGPPLPVAVYTHAAAVIGGFLFVVGGSGFSAGPFSTVYYAAINADGSLGPWQTGPSVPQAVSFNLAPGNGVGLTDSALILVGGGGVSSFLNSVQSLTVNANGPGAWRTSTGPTTGSYQAAAFPSGNGGWQIVWLIGYTSYYIIPTQLSTVVSVPLPTTGLTNAGTYHIVMSQGGGGLNDYLSLGWDQNVYAGNPTAKYRPRNPPGAWTAYTSGQAIPIAVYDQTPGGQILHAWEDSGARNTTFVWATTPDTRLLGIAETTTLPGPVLNSNWSFTGGTAPWVATGGTLTLSSAQVQGGLPSSALLTPTGSAATSSVESEKEPINQGRSYTATAWLYSPTGYANVALNINWYAAGGTLLSTTAGTVAALGSGTWTQYSTSGTAPALAAYATIVPIETGTPPGTALLYISAATLQETAGSSLASVAAVGYGGTWPSSTTWPPLSVTQMA